MLFLMIYGLKVFSSLGIGLKINIKTNMNIKKKIMVINNL